MATLAPKSDVATLPLSTTQAPATQADLAATVRTAAAERTPLYPLGGRTALNFGNSTKSPGLGLSSEKLTQVVDYPARDMTITVEAGITLAALREVLATERQYLPVDAAQPERATLGGFIATNFSGPRRYGCGTLRDYVIGISAVDGHGTLFKAGGRVVKNVAGYDFCRLLIGSLGTLAVVAQATLKVKPIPAASVLAVADLATPEQAESFLARLVDSRTTPSAIELLAGPDWTDAPSLGESDAKSPYKLIVGLEGTGAEVEWMIARLKEEWHTHGAAPQIVAHSAAEALWSRLIEFGCGSPVAASVATPGASLVFKINVPSSRVVAICEQVRASFPHASLLSHAGSGIVLVRVAETPSHELVTPLIKTLHPAVAAAGGQCILWQSPSADDFTRQLAWGPLRSDSSVMQRVKRQLDPHGILNPGRFPW